MKIDYHKNFQKNYSKRIKHNKNLDRIFKERIVLFSQEHNNSLFDDHKLSGKMSKLRSFSITGDIRVIYRRISKDLVLFMDIGSHNQVY